MGMMSKEIGDFVGDRIGEVLNVDLDDNEEAMGAFTRIKVRTDITTPLMRFRILITDDDEEEQELPNEEVMGGEEDEIEGKRKEKEKIISFEYEYLPDFCYNCGIIGHTKKACPTRSRREGARHFGPWNELFKQRESKLVVMCDVYVIFCDFRWLQPSSRES